MRLVKRMMIAAGVLAAMVLVPASAAHATSRTCSLNGVIWTNEVCVTSGVWANPGGWIDFHVGPYSGCSLDYRVRDVITNVVVASGRASGDYSRRVTGLTNAYSLWIKKVKLNCGGDGIIENEG